MATQLLLKDVRCSFPVVFNAEPFDEDSEPRYSCKFLLPKGSEVSKMVDAAIMAEAKAAWPDDWQEKLESFKGNPQKTCVINGDSKKTEGYAGNIVLSSYRKEDAGRPGVVDLKKSPITKADGKIYSGCHLNGSIEIWAQRKGKYIGIRATLLAVQFFRDGEAFSGGGTPNLDVFEDLSPSDTGNVSALRTGTNNAEMGALY